MPGYHLYEIPRGKIGFFSKIAEEFLEFCDAIEQNCHVMALVELSDLMGSMKQYFKSHDKEKDWELLIQNVTTMESDLIIDFFDLRENFTILNGAKSWNSFELFLFEIKQYIKRYNLNLNDLICMSNITERVFVNGYRTSRTD